MASCQVKVNEGMLQGKRCSTCDGKQYYGFEGIPYARPPVGTLRFRNPEPPEPWTGMRDATKPGNKCIQSNPYSSTPLDGSEDCLYLNVYTPSLPAEKIEKLPVLFFVHGGRLIYGYGNYYTPDYLIKHDVILVTINYRLHILGWLCLDLPECPGNAGLKDAVMALRWVNRNISKFNGDEENVTLWGESAGGAIVTSFLTSKMGDGLYSKIIAQSGNSVADLYLIEEESIKKAANVASILRKNLTDPRELYNFLSQVPIEDLIFAVVTAELSRPRSVINAYFLPVVEKKFDGVERFFDEHPRVAIKENRFRKVPLLTAVNSHEGAIFIVEGGNIFYEQNFEYFIPQYAFIEKNTHKSKAVARKIRDFYMQGKPVDDNSKLEYLQLVSDVYFWRDILLFAENVSKYWDQLYVLQFNYSGNMHTRVMKSIGVEGATHGDMIQYQFYRKSKAAKCTERDKKVVGLLAEACCQFAKTGKPRWSNQPVEWRPYTADTKLTLMIDDDITLERNLGLERLNFWSGLSKDYINTVSKL